MKAYTDLEQSMRLANFLPLESADMFWLVLGDKPRIHVLTEPFSNYRHWESYLAWSLASLLNYLREIDLFPAIEADEHGVTMRLNYYDEEEGNILNPVHTITIKAENFVDACCEMIIKIQRT